MSKKNKMTKISIGRTECLSCCIMSKASPNAAPDVKQEVQESAVDPVICGNGNRGNGAPGERQVNSAQQDIDNAPNITQSETSIAAFGPFMLFGFNDSNLARFGNLSGFGFSSDRGITWSNCGNVPLNPGWTNDGDPVIAVDRNGIFYYSQISKASGLSNISIATATVNRNTRRLTMNNPFIAGVTGGVAARFQDKEWMAVGPDPGRGPQAQAIYLTWTDFPATNDPDPNTHIRFAKWTTGVNPQNLIAGKNIVTAVSATGSFPVVDRNGNIYVFYEDLNGNFLGNTRAIRMVKSTDRGQTFSAPITVSNVTRAGDITLCGNSQRTAIVVSTTKVIRLMEFPSASIGPDGTIYVVWNDGVNKATTGIDVLLAYSQNQGATWTVRQVTNGVTDEFMPSVTANRRGAHIQYSKFGGTTIGIGNGRFALFMKNFTIAGGFSAETMVSTVFSLVPDTRPNFDTSLNPCYMGDYNQIISGPDNVLYHAWGDNRNNPVNGNNPDVFFIQTGRLKKKCCCRKFIKTNLSVQE